LFGTGNRPTSDRQNFYDLPFWDACSQGQFLIQRCRSCGHAIFPGAPICPECWSWDLRWDPASGDGLVYSWIRMHRKYFDEVPPPYTCVLVELAEGPFFITNYRLRDEGRDPIIGEPVSIRIVQFDNVSLPIAFPAD